MKKVLGIFLMIFSFPGMPLAHYEGTWSGRGWRHMMSFGYGGILMWSIFLIILGLLIFIIIKSIKSGGQDISPSPHHLLEFTCQKRHRPLQLFHTFAQLDHFVEMQLGAGDGSGQLWFKASLKISLQTGLRFVFIHALVKPGQL